MATTAARHAGRAAELAWPPSSHADSVEARGASLWRPTVVMAIETLREATMQTKCGQKQGVRRRREGDPDAPAPRIPWRQEADWLPRNAPRPAADDAQPELVPAVPTAPAVGSHPHHRLQTQVPLADRRTAPRTDRVVRDVTIPVSVLCQIGSADAAEALLKLASLGRRALFIQLLRGGGRSDQRTRLSVAQLAATWRLSWRLLTC